MATTKRKQAKRAAAKGAATPRRRFLMHGLGLAAAGVTGAAIGQPSVPVDATARVKHHLKELQRALEDSYPTMRVAVSTRYAEGGFPALIIGVIPAEKQFIPPSETAIG